MKLKWKTLLLLACFLWAVSFIATKVALRTTPALIIATLRLWAASICFLGWYFIRKPKLNVKGAKAWWALFVLSLIGMGHYGVQTIGLKFTNASNASLYTVTGPISIILLAAVFLNERITLKKTIGVFLAVLGVLTVMGLNALLALELPVHFWGDLLVLTSVAMWGAFTVFGKKKTIQLGALSITAITTIMGALWMIPVGWVEARQYGFSFIQIDQASWLAIAFLGVGCSFFATLLYFMALQHSESQKVGVYLYTIPPMTAVCAALYLGESIGLNLIAGSVLIFGGVYLTELG